VSVPIKGGEIGAVAMNVEQPAISAKHESVTSMSRTAEWWGVPRELILALVVLAIALTVTVIPAPFLIDDVNYLETVAALRHGRLTAPGTEGLTPSAELLFFDPGPEERVVASTPVVSNAPPLYAVIAYPFSFLGWRGLVALNTLGYLVTIALVYRYARRFASDAMTPWLAALAVGLGGFAIEYAQGVWPHGVSLALCTGALLLVADVLNGASPVAAAVAGFLLALATGVRYQNAVLIVIAVGAMALWSPRRWRTTAAFVAAAAIPLAASAALNHARLGSWNPISKGPGYLYAPMIGSAESAFDPLLLFWARLVDFSARPPLIGPQFGWVTYNPTTGGHLIFGVTLQKGFLQSAPWAVLALILFAAAWRPRSVMSNERRRSLQLFSLITLALPLVFALAGRWRHEGASLNQRYLLELLPLTAIAFAWAVDGMKFRIPIFGTGALWGGLIFVVVMAIPIGAGRQIAILKVPLLIALALAAGWLLAQRRQQWRQAMPFIVCLSIGWALSLHLVDDVLTARFIRQYRVARTSELRTALPDQSALVTYWGSRDAAGPLLLEKDLVVLDAHADEGKSAPTLIRELLARGRRVYLFREGMPDEVFRRVTSGMAVVGSRSNRIGELRMLPEPEPQ
jgi:hypothetical protein